ncbi:MAG: hypothetical protein GY856_20305 [bacterium]|nr:hypothetical protein [bacterium]
MLTRRAVNMVFLSAAILVSTAIPATAAQWSAAPDVLIDEDALSAFAVVVPAEGPAPPGATITKSGTVTCSPPPNLSSCWLSTGASWMVEFDQPIAADRLRIQLNNSDSNDGTMHVDVDADGTIDYSLFTGQPPGVYRHIHVLGKEFQTISAVKIMAGTDGHLSLDYVALEEPSIPSWSAAPDVFVEEDAVSSFALVAPAEGPEPPGAKITPTGSVLCSPFSNTSSCWISSGGSWMVEFDQPVPASTLRIQLNNSDDNDGTMHVEVDADADGTIEYSYYTGQPANTYRHIHVIGTGFHLIKSVKIIAGTDGDLSLDYVALDGFAVPWWSAEPAVFVDEDVLPPYVDVVPGEGPAPPGATITKSAECASGSNSSTCWIDAENWWMVEFDHPVAANRLRIQINAADENDGTMHVDLEADGTVDFSYLARQSAGTSRNVLVLGTGFYTVSAVKIIAANDGKVSLDYVALGKQFTIFPTTDGRWSGGEWKYSPDEAKAELWTDFFVPAQGPEPFGAMITKSGTGCPPTGWPPGYEQFCWLYGSSEDWWRVDFFPELSYLKMYIRFRDCDNNDGWAEVYVNDTLQVAYDSYYPTEPGNNPTNGLLVGRGLPPISSVEIKTILGDGDVSLDYLAFSDPPIPSY